MTVTPGAALVIRNHSQGTVVCRRADLARGFGSRARGLMLRRDWRGFDGLVLRPCTSIHTCFMRMAIDVCFVDEQWRVLRAVPALRPWRFCLGTRGARSVLELPAGALLRTGTKIGDRLSLEGPEIS